MNFKYLFIKLKQLYNFDYLTAELRKDIDKVVFILWRGSKPYYSSASAWCYSLEGESKLIFQFFEEDLKDSIDFSDYIDSYSSSVAYNKCIVSINDF